MKICPICKAEIHRKDSQKQSVYKKQKTCSLKCRGEYIALLTKNKWKPKICLNCGNTIEKHNARRIYCDDACMRKHRRGVNSPNWKGGVKKHGEYLQESCKGHPFADMHGYVLQHRLVMERYLIKNDKKEFLVLIGDTYCLAPHVKIHHKNHNKSDNRIENLAVVSSQREHFHYNFCPHCTHCKQLGELLENPERTTSSQV